MMTIRRWKIMTVAVLTVAVLYIACLHVRLEHMTSEHKRMRQYALSGVISFRFVCEAIEKALRDPHTYGNPTYGHFTAARQCIGSLEGEEDDAFFLETRERRGDAVADRIAAAVRGLGSKGTGVKRLPTMPFSWTDDDIPSLF